MPKIYYNKGKSLINIKYNKQYSNLCQKEMPLLRFSSIYTQSQFTRNGKKDEVQRLLFLFVYFVLVSYIYTSFNTDSLCYYIIYRPRHAHVVVMKQKWTPTTVYTFNVVLNNNISSVDFSTWHCSFTKIFFAEFILFWSFYEIFRQKLRNLIFCT